MGRGDRVHYGLDDCDDCWGEGETECPYCDDFEDEEGSAAVRPPCDYCKDTGLIKCTSCGGSGREH